MQKKVLLGCSMGNLFEWYDFIVYAQLAPILSQLFFPVHNKILAVTLTLVIFAIGYIVRPLGGLYFGYLGDKYGRKKAMIASIMLIAFPSVGIFLLPTYAHIGYFAIFLLLFFRLLQGFSIGGELPGLIIYFAELSPNATRGFYTSLTGLIPGFGILLATGVMMFLNILYTHQQILSWAWRLPFFISVLLIVLGFYLRVTLVETTVFNQVKDRLVHPIKHVFQHEKLTMFKMLVFTTSVAISYYTFNVFLTVYLTSFLNIAFGKAAQISLFGVVVYILLTPIFGKLVDRLGRKKQSILTCIGLIIFSYPIYALFNTKIMQLMLLGQFIFAALLSAYASVCSVYLCEQVGTKARYTALALPQNLAFAIFGGTAPLVNIWLIGKLHTTLAPIYYIIFAAIIGIVASLSMKDKTGRNL